MRGQEEYELVYRSPEGDVSVDIVSGSVPGQRIICLMIEEADAGDDEAGGLFLAGHIRRIIRRLENAQEAIEARYQL